VNCGVTSRIAQPSNAAMQCEGCNLHALHHATNSTGSMRRSPISVLWTNDGGLRRRLASARCVRPASVRHFRSRPHSRRYGRECCDLAPKAGATYPFQQALLTWERHPLASARPLANIKLRLNSRCGTVSVQGRVVHSGFAAIKARFNVRGRDSLIGI
jgi:hypothetical protein